MVFGRLHVLPVVADFLRAYPEIDIRLALADRVFNLHEEGVDVALRIGALPDSSLIATRVGTIRQVVCGSPDYFVAKGKPTRPEELRQHDVVTFEGLTSPQSWKFLVDGVVEAVAVRSRLIASTAEAAIDAALLSVGLTRVLSYQTAKRGCGGDAWSRAGGIRARAVAGESGLCRSGTAAVEDAGVSRFRRAAAQGAPGGRSP